MYIYIPQLYNQLPVDVCNHIMKYMGTSPTSKLLESKCNNFKYYTYRYGGYLQKVICINGFYSYIMFKHDKYLTRKQQFDLIFANWLYNNPKERNCNFVDYYREESISAIVYAGDAGVGDAMVDFIGGNTTKFIVCNIFCIYIHNFIKFLSYTIFDFEIIDLLRIYQDDPTFIDEQFGFFRNCEFEKINKEAFIDYAEDFDDDNATDISFE